MSHAYEPPFVALPTYSISEERFNRFTHAAGLVLSVVGTLALVLATAGSNDWRLVSAASLYGVSLVFMFLSSTVYHTVTKTSTRTLFRLLDHCAIYVLIAGSYTPFLLVSLRDHRYGLPLTVGIWVAALLGVVLELTLRQRYKGLSVATYLAMGWAVVIVGQEMVHAVHTTALLWMLAGGILFSVGVFFYVQRAIQYNHGIWHVFVLGGCACHFVSIYGYVL
jgi:hemolysin III